MYVFFSDFASVNGTLPELEVKCMLLGKGQCIVLGSASVKKCIL